MKAFLTNRSELTWAAMAIPALFLAHWMVVTLGPLLLRCALPESVRTLVHLL